MAKVDPYLRPLFDALHDMLEPERVSQHLERGVIEVAPLAFMRGRTLNDSFIILDEAQNTTPEQMKMFLTRLGFNSKMVVTGDITQIDLPREQDSGLVVVSRHPRRRSRASSSSASARRTSSGTSSCGGSSPPTTSTRSGWRPSCGRAKRVPDDAATAAARRRGDRDRDASPDGGPTDGRGRGAVRAGARRRPGSTTATWRSSSSTRSGSASSTASTAAMTRRPTCSRSGSTRTAPAAGPRELGDIVICPEHTADLREAVVHGALHLTGMDHETDDGEMLALQAELMRWVRVSRRRSRTSTRSGLHRPRRPPERRQVDARQRDRRRQGRDRLRQAADDPPRDPRRRHRPRLAARAGRPARRAAPARRADRADAASRRARARRRRRLPDGAQRRAGHRSGRPVHRRRCSRGGAGPGRDRGQQGRSRRPREDGGGAARRPPSSSSPTRSSRSRRARARVCRR